MQTADEILERNRAFYQACALNYDAGRRFSFRREGARVAADLSWLGQFIAIEEAVVLDVGCGTGFYALAAAGQGARKFHCLDIEPVFLEETGKRLLTAHPEAQVHCHQADLESFVRERADLLPDIDIWIMGSVLQYVPEHVALLTKMARAVRHGCFYLTSTRLPGGGRWPRLESVLARFDYALHRLLHPGERGQKGLPVTKVTLEVDPQVLERVFREQGFTTRLYTYSAFHTLLFSGLHRLLRRPLPSLGTHFTLLAVGLGEGEGLDTHKEIGDGLDVSR